MPNTTSNSGAQMPTRLTHRRPAWIGSRAALAAAVIAALAIAAPAAPASAATTPTTAVAKVVAPTLTGDVFNGRTEIASSHPAIGPRLTGDLFNGATTIVSSPSSAAV
jgi:hypothetical protein